MYPLDREKSGKFIAQLRHEKGLTQKELAEKLFISDKAVSKWETGVIFLTLCCSFRSAKYWA